MTVNIKPSIAHGEITAPPSKSASHRALICAALSCGSKVGNVAYSEDIKATLAALSALGAKVEISGDSVNIGGIDINGVKPDEIDVRESGSTLRFLIPLALLGGKKTLFTGAKRLFERDLSVYEEIAGKQNIQFVKTDNSLTVCGKLKSGEYRVRGDVSSQFVSGLMFALPLLEGDSIIRFTTNVESRPYIDMTVNMLSRFGVDIIPISDGYRIPGDQTYKSQSVTVEGDYSNAAFLDAFNLFGGSVTVKGLNGDTAQGDRVYKDIFGSIKSGGTYDLRDCPDLAPLLFSLAAAFSGARFIGTARLKIKESDRANAMREELLKFGAKVTVGENEVVIEKSALCKPSAPLCSHNDHRIVMALCVLAGKYGGVIKGAEAVNKSYPAFFEDINKLGIEVSVNEDQ